MVDESNPCLWTFNRLLGFSNAGPPSTAPKHTHTHTLSLSLSTSLSLSPPLSPPHTHTHHSMAVGAGKVWFFVGVVVGLAVSSLVSTMFPTVLSPTSTKASDAIAQQNSNLGNIEQGITNLQPREAAPCICPPPAPCEPKIIKEPCTEQPEPQQAVSPSPPSPPSPSPPPPVPWEPCRG